MILFKTEVEGDNMKDGEHFYMYEGQRFCGSGTLIETGYFKFEPYKYSKKDKRIYFKVVQSYTGNEGYFYKDRFQMPMGQSFNVQRIMSTKNGLVLHIDARMGDKVKDRAIFFYPFMLSDYPVSVPITDQHQLVFYVESKKGLKAFLKSEGYCSFCMEGVVYRHP